MRRRPSCLEHRVEGDAKERGDDARHDGGQWTLEHEHDISPLFAIHGQSNQACMIGASACWMRAICAGVVIEVSSRPKWMCCTPEMMYCQR